MDCSLASADSASRPAALRAGKEGRTMIDGRMARRRRRSRRETQFEPAAPRRRRPRERASRRRASRTSRRRAPRAAANGAARSRRGDADACGAWPPRSSAASQARLPGRVRDLKVRVEDDQFVLSGVSSSYYVKQVAQHVAMNALDALMLGRLVNEIEVRSVR